MNVTDQMLGEQWTETEFEVTPQVSVSVPCRGRLEAQLDELKERLVKPVLDKVAGVNGALAREISWAANEAAALAWFTICPLLVLPTLLEEKVRSALLRWEKQKQMLHG